ncbi:MAG: hypothetical protein PQJ44_06865 [Sphaerochaetaceae bacterium]|nr:hypothetical protein [Sphaerochaetaceae bacterium]
MKQTAGEKEKKVREDTTKYDPLEVGHAVSDDFMIHLEECAKLHEKTFDQKEFCVVFVLCDDPLLKTVTRRKFYAWPFLPKPRPRQGCFLYNTVTGKFKRLWILPQAGTMSILSTSTNVDNKWKTMKSWSDAFFDGTFHEYIRKEHNINMLSEAEYLKINGNKIVNSASNAISSNPTDPLDFAKVAIEKIVDTSSTACNE